jgi:hypothetical protein
MPLLAWTANSGFSVSQLGGILIRQQDVSFDVILGGFQFRLGSSARA